MLFYVLSDPGVALAPVGCQLRSEPQSAHSLLVAANTPRRPSESSLRLVWPTIPRRLRA